MPRRSAAVAPRPLPLAPGGSGRRPMRGVAEAAKADNQPPHRVPPSALTLDELPVHKRKVADVQAWLAEALGSGAVSKYRVGAPALMQRILALTGPCGAGKTWTVQALAHANALDFDIVEWENQESLYDRGARQSAIERFAAFVHSAQRYPLLPLAPRNGFRAAPRRRRKIVLVEDLPNLSHEPTRAQFHQVLEQVVETPSQIPLVLIVSDSVPRSEDETATIAGAGASWRARREGQMDVRMAIPERVRHHPAFAEIRFNPITARMIQSALSAQAAQLQVPRTLLAEISSASNGDIRGAQNTLSLLAAGHARAGTKRKADPAWEVAPRGAAMALFHALGRVLYNKRLGDPGQDADDGLTPCSSWHATPRRSLVDVEALWDDLPVDPATFQLYLYHNFPSFVNDLDEAMHITDALSCAESIAPPTDELQASTAAALYGYQITTRGTLMGLPSPVPRRNQTMTKPAFFDMAQRARTCSDHLGAARAALVQAAALQDMAGRVADVALPTLATEVLPLLARIDPAWQGTLMAFSEQPTLAAAQADDLDLPDTDAQVPPRAAPHRVDRPLQTIPAPPSPRTSDEELEDL